MNKKKNTIIAVVAAAAAVIAVVIVVLTVVFIRNGDGSIKVPFDTSISTKAPRVEYDPEDYKTEICANCEYEISGKSYYPSDEFMVYLTQDYEKEDIAICEECAKGMYKDELAEGKSLDEFLRK